jgi:hypothetical protein
MQKFLAFKRNKAHQHNEKIQKCNRIKAYNILTIPILLCGVIVAQQKQTQNQNCSC